MPAVNGAWVVCKSHPHKTKARWASSEVSQCRPAERSTWCRGTNIHATCVSEIFRQGGCSLVRWAECPLAAEAHPLVQFYQKEIYIVHSDCSLMRNMVWQLVTIRSITSNTHSWSKLKHSCRCIQRCSSLAFALTTSIVNAWSQVAMLNWRKCWQSPFYYFGVDAPIGV